MSRAAQNVNYYFEEKKLYDDTFAKLTTTTTERDAHKANVKFLNERLISLEMLNEDYHSRIALHLEGDLERSRLEASSMKEANDNLEMQIEEMKLSLEAKHLVDAEIVEFQKEVQQLKNDLHSVQQSHD